MNEEEREKLKGELEALKTLIATAKQDLQDKHSTFTSLNQVISSIQGYNEKFDEIRKKISDTENEISSNLDASTRSKSEIDALRQDSENQLTSIKTALSSVEANITTMNAEYIKFTEINSAVSNPETGLASILEKSNVLKKEIDALRQDSENQLTSIKTALSSVEANITTMNTSYDQFLLVKEKVENPETGLQSVYNASSNLRDEINALKTQSESVFKEIRSFRDEASNYLKEIEAFRVSSEEKTQTISRYEEESNDFKSKIEKIYKIATDSGLANSFDKRKKDLEKTTKNWFWALIWFTVFLAVALLFIFYPVLISKTISINESTWYRLTLTSPLIFFITFASVRYSKERSLLEKYAFKAVTAFSIEAYTTLLINTFGKDKKENEKEILSFVLSSMKSIYKEPHELVKESKMSVGLDSKLASLKADFATTMEDMKKEIVEDISKEIEGKQNKESQ